MMLLRLGWRLGGWLDRRAVQPVLGFADRHESGCAGAFYLFMIVALFMAGFLARGIHLHWPH